MAEGFADDRQGFSVLIGCGGPGMAGGIGREALW